MTDVWIVQRKDPEQPRSFAGFLVLGVGRVAATGAVESVRNVKIPLIGSIDDASEFPPLAAFPHELDVSGGPPAGWIEYEQGQHLMCKAPELADPGFWEDWWDGVPEARARYAAYISSPDVRAAIAEAQRVAQQSLNPDQPRLSSGPDFGR